MHGYRLPVAYWIMKAIISPFLYLLWRVKERFQMPTAVYNVSGEYSMIKAAAQNGWLNEREAVMELMTAFKRAGADLIITYWAREVARWL